MKHFLAFIALAIIIIGIFPNYVLTLSAKEIDSNNITDILDETTMYGSKESNVYYATINT